MVTNKLKLLFIINCQNAKDSNKYNKDEINEKINFLIQFICKKLMETEIAFYQKWPNASKWQSCEIQFKTYTPHNFKGGIR